jgi:hypothetical protein
LKGRNLDEEKKEFNQSKPEENEEQTDDFFDDYSNSDIH